MTAKKLQISGDKKKLFSDYVQQIQVQSKKNLILFQLLNFGLLP